MSFFVVARFARNKVVRSVDTKEREKGREKLRIFSLRFPLSLSFFSQTLNTWDNFFFQKSRKEKKSCHDGWNTTSVVECVKKRAKKQRKVDATTTTCRDDPSSLEKKRGGEKTQGKEEGEEHEKARE